MQEAATSTPPFDWEAIADSSVDIPLNRTPWDAEPSTWEQKGYTIPTVDSFAVFKQNYNLEVPCYLVLDEEKRFNFDYFKHVPKTALEYLTQEEIAEHYEALDKKVLREKYPNRLKDIDSFLKTPEIDWMVPGHIHKHGLTQIYGPSYGGKTLVTLDLVMSFAVGLNEWQGQPLNTGGQPHDVLYIAAEGGAALSVHVDAWMKAHPEVSRSALKGLRFLDGGDGDHVYLSINPKVTVEAEYSWERMINEIIDEGISPSIIVFDTQIDLAPAVDENSNVEMVGILRKIKTLADRMKFMAIVVHHTGHDESRARGASGMKAKCDVQIALKPIGKKSGKAQLEWQKVKGAMLPSATLPYEIIGVPGSEGAICQPISQMVQAIATHEGSRPTGDVLYKITQAIRDGYTSGAKIVQETHLSKSVVDDAVNWAIKEGVLERTGSGRSSTLIEKTVQN